VAEISLSFPKGMSNVGDPARIAEGTCRNALNVDFGNGGEYVRRLGPKLINPIGQTDSPWTYQGVSVYRRGGELRSFPSNGTIRSDLTGPVSYCNLNDSIYYSDGHITGMLRNGIPEPWGVEPASLLEDPIALLDGGMDQGAYHVTISFKRALEQGGAGLSRSVIVPQGGGILLDNLPVPQHADTIVVYCSMCNGDELFWYGEFPATIGQVRISRFQSDIKLEPDVQFGDAPPPGRIIIEHNGRIYIANGPNIFYSADVQRYGLFNGTSLFWFDADVTMVCRVPDAGPLPGGIYVATRTRTAFISGIDSEKAPYYRDVLDYGCPFQRQTVELPETGQNGAKKVLWFSHRGFVVGGAGGTVQNVTEDTNAVAQYDEVRLDHIEMAGMKRVVATGFGGVENPLASQDWVDWEYMKKGDAL
jgi:hypothetical protein